MQITTENILVNATYVKTTGELNNFLEGVVGQPAGLFEAGFIAGRAEDDDGDLFPVLVLQDGGEAVIGLEDKPGLAGENLVR